MHTSIYKFGLSVCLFVSNKRQNGWTDRAQIFCGASIDHREGLWMIKISNICLHQTSIVIKFLKILKTREIFLWKSANCFCFVLRCTQREHVHNLFRRWLVIYIIPAVFRTGLVGLYIYSAWRVRGVLKKSNFYSLSYPQSTNGFPKKMPSIRSSCLATYTNIH